MIVKGKYLCGKKRKQDGWEKAEIFVVLCFIILKEICDPVIKVINFNKELGNQVKTGEEKRLQIK